MPGRLPLFNVSAVRRLADLHARAQGARSVECGERMGRRAIGAGDYLLWFNYLGPEYVRVTGV